MSLLNIFLYQQIKIYTKLIKNTNNSREKMSIMKSLPDPSTLFLNRSSPRKSVLAPAYGSGSTSFI